MSDLNPYTPPQTPSSAAPADRPSATKLAKIGAWLQMLPLLGSIGTVIGLLNAFETLGTSGVGDPSHLSAAIGEVLISTALGFMGGMVGCVMLWVAVFVQRCSARWVRVVFWLSVLPALIGAFMLVMLVVSASRGAY